MKFKQSHGIYENYNVQDLSKSLIFYSRALGLTEKKRKIASDESCIIVYIGDKESEIELTWNVRPSEKYNFVNEELHLAFLVDDFDKAYKLHQEMGCICTENLRMGIYSIKDPDGHEVKIISEKYQETIQEFFDTLMLEGLSRIEEAILVYKSLSQEFCTTDKSLQKSSNKDIDSCLSNIGSAIEKILKALLLPIDWRLVVVKNTKKRTNNDLRIDILRTNDLKTIGAQEAFELLSQFSLLEIPDALKKWLFSHREFRNQQEHFTVHNGLNSVKAILSKVMDSISGIVVLLNEIEHEELCYKLSRETLDVLERISEGLAGMNSFYMRCIKIAEERAIEAGADLNALKICPSCEQKFLEIGHKAKVFDEKNTCYCYFCNYSATPEEAAELYVENIHKLTCFDINDIGRDSVFVECPNCNEETLIEYGEIDKTNKWVCFSCGMECDQSHILTCCNCNNLYYDYYGEESSKRSPHLCNNCLRNIKK